MSLAERRSGNRSVIPDTTRREADMSTAQQHGDIPDTAVQFAPGLWRTSLQRYDLSVPGREMIQSRVDVEPGSPPIRHTHPGEEIIYVLAGSLEYQIDGQPAKVYHAGQALTVPAGAIHAVRNTGTGTGTALATDIVEKGKPLLTVAQQAPRPGRAP
jgi:quercetin dioxygenase-like cupin family protein